MKRVVCVGNRFVPSDSAGPRVFDHLCAGPPISGLEFIDGGTAGLNLLSLGDGCERVVFVDSVQGYGAPGSLVLLDGQEIPWDTSVAPHHGAGLAALVNLLPRVCEGPPPEILVLGVESPADDGAVRAAAKRGIAIALGGRGTPRSEPRAHRRESP